MKSTRPASLEYALPTGSIVDEHQRISSWPDKRVVPCPQQDAKTLVLVLLGQSNAANHGGQHFYTKYGARVVNFHAGACSIAGSPLLGATGQGGEPWTALADRLIASGAAGNVVLVPFAVQGSGIKRWAPGGKLHAAFIDELSRATQWYTPTHLLWLQGESDFASQTPAIAYGMALRSMIQSIRKAGIRAPMYVAIASRCAEAPHWNAENDVAAAQRAAVDFHLGVRRGPDLDRILDIGDRYDGCHLSGNGLLKTAQAWASSLEGY